MMTQIHQANAGDDLMMPTLQSGNHPARLGEIVRLAENFIIQKNQRVRGEHERIGNFFGHYTRLTMRVELANFKRREMVVGDFIRVTGQDLKFNRQQFEEFRATRRGRSQNERRQFHNFSLPEFTILSSAGKIRRASRAVFR